MPPIVGHALALAERMRFPHSCLPETGRLLAVLAASQRIGPVAEIGTGCGVGAAWIMSALPPDVSFITIDLDGERVAAARELFASYPNVKVLHGDWHEILSHGPFTLLFADGGDAKQREGNRLIDAMRPGGIVVLDDLTPVEHWPKVWHRRPDPVREFWLRSPRIQATEVIVTPPSVVPGMAVFLATRV